MLATSPRRFAVSCIGLAACLAVFPLIWLLALAELLLIPASLLFLRRQRSAPAGKLVLVAREPEHVVDDAGLSSVVFLHGWPDDETMWDAYVYTSAEGGRRRRRAWLRGRRTARIVLPNGRTNPVVPSLSALWSRAVREEVGHALEDLASSSPTGKLLLVAHDWGANYAWHFARRVWDEEKIEGFVSFSVGNGMRADAFELGARALLWSYSLVSAAPYYFPGSGEVVAMLLRSAGGWPGERAITECDSWHYAGSCLWVLGTQFFSLLLHPSLAPRPALHAYEVPPFPVLFVRTGADRIASTSAFEDALRRDRRCKLLVLSDSKHWALMTHASELAELVARWCSELV